MDVFFRSRKFQKLCNSEKAMFRELGKKRADKLKTRLNELRAVEIVDTH